MKQKWIMNLCLASFAASCIFGFLFYHHNNANYHVQIPISMGKANTPYTEVVIEGQSYLLEVDLGSKSPLTLKKSFLERIDKKSQHGMGQWKDMKGNSYQTPIFLVPKIKIADLSFKEIAIQQEDDDSIFNSTVWDEENKGRKIVEKQHGSIGRPLFEKVNLLLDLKHSIFIASNQKDKLQKMGYSIDSLLKVPFEMSRIGITLSIETDIGIKKLAIDTGSSLNLIRSSQLQEQECKNDIHGIPIYTSTKFIINGKDFGKTSLHLYKIAEELNEIDGILGMPFLEKHILYIDFPNRIVYLGKSS